MARYGHAQSDRILPGYGGDLVAITAEGTLNPRDSIDPPADALRNGLGELVLLDGLSWVIDAQQEVESADPPTVTVGMPGGGVSLSIRFGDKPITAGEVPIYCLRRAERGGDPPPPPRPGRHAGGGLFPFHPVRRQADHGR